MKIIALIMASLLTGCASIAGHETQSIIISSRPSNAKISITDEGDWDVFEGRTPAKVNLKKNEGNYFGGKDYTVRISKKCYDSRLLSISSYPNAWYFVGNLFFGGLIGYFIVDPQNGGMYTLSPEKIDVPLRKSVDCEKH